MALSNRLLIPSTYNFASLLFFSTKKGRYDVVLHIALGITQDPLCFSLECPLTAHLVIVADNLRDFRKTYHSPLGKR